MFQIEFTEKFKKSYKKLPQNVQKKIDKQLVFLQENISHPSLNIKKMQGMNRWEARADKSYRFTFEKSNNTILLRTVGQHDEGLGKK